MALTVGTRRINAWVAGNQCDLPIPRAAAYETRRHEETSHSFSLILNFTTTELQQRVVPRAGTCLQCWGSFRQAKRCRECLGWCDSSADLHTTRFTAEHCTGCDTNLTEITRAIIIWIGLACGRLVKQNKKCDRRVRPTQYAPARL